jgi:hypothetical protein
MDKVDEPFIFDARLKIPFGLVIAGPPKAGKSHFILNLLASLDRLVDKKFDKIVWFYGEETESIRKLESTFPHLNISSHKGLPDDFAPFYNEKFHTLLILDDCMMHACSNKNVVDILANKLQHSNVSTIFSLQNLYFKSEQRTTMLRCCHYMVIFKNPLDMSIVSSLARKILPHSIRTFTSIFAAATQQPHSFLFMDGSQTTPDKARLRSNIFDKEGQRVFIPMT